MLYWSESPAAERILGTLLTAGANPNLPRAKGKVSTYKFAKKCYSDTEVGKKAIRILKEFGGKEFLLDPTLIAHVNIFICILKGQCRYFDQGVQR